MSAKLAVVPDATLARASRDERLSSKARRQAGDELARRANLTNHCPRGKGCADWTCTKEH